jgi:hypothetical protein
MPAYNASFALIRITPTSTSKLTRPSKPCGKARELVDSRQADDEVFFHSYECAGSKDVKKSRCVTPTARRFNSGWMTTWRCATQPPSFAMRWKPLSNAIAPKPPPPVLAMTK